MKNNAAGEHEISACGREAAASSAEAHLCGESMK